jgi:hypothetical protein
MINIIATNSIYPGEIMSKPKTPREALANAPIGTQWFAVTTTGTKTIRKTTTGLEITTTGKGGIPNQSVSLNEAVSFYNTNKMTKSNRPEWYVNPTPTPAPAPPNRAPKPTTDPNTTATSSNDTPSITPESQEIIAAPETSDTGIVVTNPRPILNNAYDWRVRLSLSPGSKYLYNDPDVASRGILEPLYETRGVIFPYTPQVTVSYSANYNSTDLVHNNYKIHQYASSSVDTVTLTCDFTAQDTKEARYVLAVIHFFRSVTKMFFGNDENPIAGTPPPLCFLTGLGEYQFSEHPLVLTNFSYVLPNDVDYIQTIGPQRIPFPRPLPDRWRSSRLPPGVVPGGESAPPNFSSLQLPENEIPSYVPSKITMTVSGMPVVSRERMARDFSLKNYGSGEIYRKGGGSFW